MRTACTVLGVLIITTAAIAASPTTAPTRERPTIAYLGPIRTSESPMSWRATPQDTSGRDWNYWYGGYYYYGPCYGYDYGYGYGWGWGWAPGPCYWGGGWSVVVIRGLPY